MASPRRIDFQKTIAQLVEHDIGRPLLGMATGSQLKRLAREIAHHNLYDFPLFIDETVRQLELSGDPAAFVRDHLEHLLWVQHRVARWLSGVVRSTRSLGCRLNVEGFEHLQATSGFPTVVVTPRTLCNMDGLWAIGSACDSRPMVVYGEDVDRDEEVARMVKTFRLDHLAMQGGSGTAPRAILRVLNRKGLFVTYPDFVYAGHKVHHGTLLGRPWAFSSSFLSLCARHQTMLLPCAAERNGNTLTLHFDAPVHILLPPGAASDRRWTTHLLSATVARLLEAMILRNPAQWLLLPTLFAECRGRAFS